MANYKQLSYGSTGGEVVRLQEKLNEIGNYGLDTDGIYGDKTQAAVKDYQQKNSLKVDGVAGDETFGSLYKTQAGTSAPATPSNNVLQAEALLQQQLQKPGAYTSSWQAQLDDILQKIQNREKFSYDMNADALYQQLKDQHVQLGQMASMDAMGQAAALTGGYGSSYGQAVGQQAYQRNLQALMDKAPELYQLALNQYNAEGDELYKQASLAAGMEERDYGRYRDQVSDAQWDKSFQYQQDRDKKADEKWQAEFDEAKRQYDQQYAISAGKGSGDRYTYTGDAGSNNEDADGTSVSWFDNLIQGITNFAENKTSPGETGNTKLFRSSVMTPTEFSRHGKASVDGKIYTNYASYIEACLEKWTNKGVPGTGATLTDDEVLFLMNHYGF